MKVIPSWGVTSLQNVVHASFMPCYTQQYVAQIRSTASMQGLQVVNMYECMPEWACLCASARVKNSLPKGNFGLLVLTFTSIYETISGSFFRKKFEIKRVRFNMLVWSWCFIRMLVLRCHQFLLFVTSCLNHAKFINTFTQNPVEEPGISGQSTIFSWPYSSKKVDADGSYFQMQLTTSWNGTEYLHWTKIVRWNSSGVGWNMTDMIGWKVLN